MVGMKTDPMRGVALVILAASLWGTTGTAHSLADGALAAAWFGALRLLAAALFFAAFAALGAPRRATHAAQAGAAWPACIGAGLCMAAYNLAFFAGVRASGVALGTVVALGSGPLWAGVLQALLQRRWPPRPWWIGTLLAVTGGALMAGIGSAAAPRSADAWGLACCAIAGLSYAIYALLSKRLAATLPASAATLRAFAVAALVAVPLAAWSDGMPATLAWRDAAAVLYLGVAATGVAYWLFGLALVHVSAATGVTLALFEPVVACVLAAVVLSEAMVATAWVGLCVVLAGVAVVVRAESRQSAPVQAGAVA